MKRSIMVDGLLRGRLGWALLLYLVLLSGLFYGVFVPGQTKFSNDGPLGELMAQCHKYPDRFFGCWSDLNSVGFNSGTASLGISSMLLWLMRPLLFSKFYAIVSLLILGMGAWFFFRELRLAPLACVLGGLAAMLNSTYFSVACWGVSSHDIAVGMTFFSLAMLADTESRPQWLRLVLAGCAVGLGVIEGADIGALFSLLITAFLLFQTCAADGPFLKMTARGAVRLLLVVVCAGLLAAQTVSGLVNTSIKGVAGTSQDAQTKAQRWDWATQWSLPKCEALSLFVPGLFGYRMDTPGGGNYWGKIGRDPAWDKYLEGDRQGLEPKGPLRYTGGGNYAGVLVMMVAFWTVTGSFFRNNSVFNLAQKKWIWFWLGIAICSLLLAFGRFAPFYKWFYALPYASTIRNPDKWLYLFSMAFVVLFAFGIDGLWRNYLTPDKPIRQRGGLLIWWNRASQLERFWMYASALVFAASMAGWMIYAGHRDELVTYLQSAQVNAFEYTVADFSIHQVGWFNLLFVLAAGLLTLIFSGAFASGGSQFGGILLGLFLVTDLGMADQPWIVYWNYKEKYASNPVLDLLRANPQEHRVTLVPLQLPPQLMVLSQLYQGEWLQHQFPFYNIQSFDVVQMSRIPQDYQSFMGFMGGPNRLESLHNLFRAWQLTNTRYLLAPTIYPAICTSDGLDYSRIRRIYSFKLVPKMGVVEVNQMDQLTAVPDPNGEYSIFENAEALPRAGLYSRWEVNTNNPAALRQLFDPAFKPERIVIVNEGMASDSEAVNADLSPGEVETVSYSPKKWVLRTDASAPSVLLLNDHFDPGWQVRVDGRPETLLRCNSLMRGVHLTPGKHRVEFTFQPPVRMLGVSLAATLGALLALGFYVFSRSGA